MRMLRFKTAPIWDIQNDELYGGYEEIVISIETIVDIRQMSDGPNGMKRTLFILSSGAYRHALGSVEDFIKSGAFGDVYTIFPAEEE